MTTVSTTSTELGAAALLESLRRDGVTKLNAKYGTTKSQDLACSNCLVPCDAHSTPLLCTKPLLNTGMCARCICAPQPLKTPCRPLTAAEKLLVRDYNNKFTTASRKRKRQEYENDDTEFEDEDGDAATIEGGMIKPPPRKRGRPPKSAKLLPEHTPTVVRLAAGPDVDQVQLIPHKDDLGFPPGYNYNPADISLLSTQQLIDKYKPAHFSASKSCGPCYAAGIACLGMLADGRKCLGCAATGIDCHAVTLDEAKLGEVHKKTRSQLKKLAFEVPPADLRRGPVSVADIQMPKVIARPTAAAAAASSTAGAGSGSGPRPQEASPLASGGGAGSGLSPFMGFSPFAGLSLDEIGLGLGGRSPPPSPPLPPQQAAEDAKARSGKEAKDHSAVLPLGPAPASPQAQAPVSPIKKHHVLGVVERCSPWHLVVWDGAFPLKDASWEPEAVRPDDGSELPRGLIYVEAMGYYSTEADAIRITNALKAYKLGVASATPQIALKKMNGSTLVLDIEKDVPSESLRFIVK